MHVFGDSVSISRSFLFKKIFIPGIYMIVKAVKEGRKSNLVSTDTTPSIGLRSSHMSSPSANGKAGVENVGHNTVIDREAGIRRMEIDLVVAISIASRGGRRK